MVPALGEAALEISDTDRDVRRLAAFGDVAGIARLGSG